METGLQIPQAAGWCPGRSQGDRIDASKVLPSPDPGEFAISFEQIFDEVLYVGISARGLSRQGETRIRAACTFRRDRFFRIVVEHAVHGLNVRTDSCVLAVAFRGKIDSQLSRSIFSTVFYRACRWRGRILGAQVAY